ncbi:MAG: hypothetical protein JWQ11_1680 [Rhizobacter sp.]|nr:hypothetical protein [Rhizobacter sp.]
MNFTLDVLDWKPWIDAMPLEACSEEQLGVLDASNRSARQSAYYLTLVHDAPALLHRSLLFNAVMYGGTQGLSRAEREFVTVVESRINGCPYCASVHARLFVQLAKDLPTMQGLLDEGPTAPMPPRLRALADYAEALTATPPRATPAHVAALRELGLSDLEIVDATHAVAMFAWANRLMQTLGEPFVAPT